MTPVCVLKKHVIKTALYGGCFIFAPRLRVWFVLCPYATLGVDISMLNLRSSVAKSFLIMCDIAAPWRVMSKARAPSCCRTARVTSVLGI